MNITENHYINFSKFHGAGNDFIMINAIKNEILLSEELIFKMCDRRTGIGADGLIILMHSDNHDFRMRYYNCDGKESTFCGNGGRCIAAFAHQQGIIKNEATYEAVDGIHKAKVTETSSNEYLVELTMRDILSYQLDDESLLIDTGSPHYVKKVMNLDSMDVNAEGAKIRYDKNISSDGVNVDFLLNDNGNIRIRTYERGVENETLACGTGVTASAMAASLWYGGNDIDIYTQIAKLNVRFDKDENTFKNVVLTGPAAHVFDGMFIFA
ncbi:MAG: diaminopimelate epimerase [Bacteroidales bacterium]|nr:diaminopimelate epimerase [Bacteroidales bacterium]